MKNNAEEIAALNSQIAELQSRLATLEAQQSKGSAEKHRARADDEGPRIIQAVERSRFEMPSNEQLRSLYETALVRFPGLRPQRFSRVLDDDDPDGFLSYVGAFEYVGNLRRSTTPNSRYGLGFWVDGCNDWLTARLKRKVYKGAVLVLAVLTQGDVEYVAADPANGVLWEFGLEPYGFRNAVGCAWQKVLQTGNLLPPTRPNRPGWSPVQIRTIGF